MIEHLPSELRDRFTDIREMDLSVQSKYNYTIYKYILGGPIERQLLLAFTFVKSKFNQFLLADGGYITSLIFFLNLKEMNNFSICRSGRYIGRQTENIFSKLCQEIHQARG